MAMALIAAPSLIVLVLAVTLGACAVVAGPAALQLINAPLLWKAPVNKGSVPVDAYAHPTVLPDGNLLLLPPGLNSTRKVGRGITPPPPHTPCPLSCVGML
jgi:hypothetical protein